MLHFIHTCRHVIHIYCCVEKFVSQICMHCMTHDAITHLAWVLNRYMMLVCIKHIWTELNNIHFLETSAEVDAYK